MTLKYSDIETLVELFGASGWTEMHLKYKGEEVFLSKEVSSQGLSSAIASAPSPVPVAASPAAVKPSSAASAPVSAGPPATGADRSGWVEIKAPNLGTFYRASSPEAAPYVEVGSAVAEDTEICLVEVMKLFTTIRAGMTGTVREIVAQDGDMVEFGATLMWIEPGA